MHGPTGWYRSITCAAELRVAEGKAALNQVKGIPQLPVCLRVDVRRDFPCRKVSAGGSGQFLICGHRKGGRKVLNFKFYRKFMTILAFFSNKFTACQVAGLPGSLWPPAKDFSRHPYRSDRDVQGIGKKSRLVALDQMAEPSQSESPGNQQESDDPVEPDHHNRRETDRNGNQVEGAIEGMTVCAVIVRKKIHMPPCASARIIARGRLPNFSDVRRCLPEILKPTATAQKSHWTAAFRGWSAESHHGLAASGRPQ